MIKGKNYIKVYQFENLILKSRLHSINALGAYINKAHALKFIKSWFFMQLKYDTEKSVTCFQLILLMYFYCNKGWSSLFKKWQLLLTDAPDQLASGSQVKPVIFEAPPFSFMDLNDLVIESIWSCNLSHQHILQEKNITVQRRRLLDQSII